MDPSPPRVWVLSARGTKEFRGDRVVVGRGHDCDVVLDDPSVSRHHLVLERHGTGWTVVDTSSGGTWVQGQRYPRLDVGVAPVELRLGAVDGERVQVWQETVAPPAYTAPAPEPASEPAPEPSPVAVPATIGRDRSNDVVLDDPLASRFHARLDIVPGRPVVLHDLASFNGVFVDGLRVNGSVVLQKGSEVVFGNQSFRWDGATLAAATSTPQELTLYADGLSTVVGHHSHQRTLLEGVSFQLEARTLTAVIGPSGAGKSTLLGALTGSRPATHGRVIWQGHDLYAAYDQLRFQIGLVPQQDIQHPQLKVRQALGYAAELRLPPDTSPAERATRVATVAQQLQLTERLDNRIGTQLSGGQRKRVSIATELLTAPPLLFLDEPTSGLDPGLDLEVMRQLRALADDGRVVMVVTHSVLALDVCDRVMVLAPGGRVAYFGPPAGVLAHFGCRSYPEVFDLLDDPDLWQRIPVPRPSTTTTQLQVAKPVPAPPRQSPGRQLATLLRRTTAVVMADRLLLAMLVLLPLLLGLLSRLVPGHHGLSLDDARSRGPNGGTLYDVTEAHQRLTVLIVAAALMGAAMTIRELVGERAIFRREYAVGLSPSVYFASKVAVLGTASFFQGVLVTVIATAGLPGADGAAGTFRVALTIGLLTLVMAVVGLYLSAKVTSTEQTMPALVGVIMVQLVLSGSLFPVHHRPLLEQVAWLAPARWGYAGAAGAMGLNRSVTGDDEPDWIASAGGAHWLLAVVMIAVLGVVAFWFGLRAVRRSATSE